jgi:glycosyltransferase involved in cell wall biosynthesis
MAAAAPAQASRPNGVAVVIPTFNEAESIAAVIAALPRDIVDTVIVADGGSTDGTRDAARGAGAEVIVVAAMDWPASPAPKRPRMPASWCLWMATAPTIPAQSRRWSRPFGRAVTTLSSPRARAANASRAAWRRIRSLPGLSPAG